MDSDETDVLLALVASLLDDLIPSPSQEDILDALANASGDAYVAAEQLRQNLRRHKPSIQCPTTSAQRPPAKKRTIQDWFSSVPSAKRKKNDNHRNNQPDEERIRATKQSHRDLVTDVKSSIGHSASDVRTVDLMSILRQPPTENKIKKPPHLPSLLLTTPELVKMHTPCTLHLSVLPPELACSLFYTMVSASKNWKKNKWWLFDRVVESPHQTSFYARDLSSGSGQNAWREAARYWYNGRTTDTPEPFPSQMEVACKIIERVVNEELRKRKRFPLEWAGDESDDCLWRANVAASNCYNGGKESVGFHSDQLTYLGPYPTIASLSLGTRRLFSLREVIPTDEQAVRRAQKFNIPLPHNSLTIMHASCQEEFKHSIPPQPSIDTFQPPFPPEGEQVILPTSCRINITFRFYRPDFHPSMTPRCECDVPMILRPDMKNRNGGLTDRYWWSCYAGAQNEGKGCNTWKVLDTRPNNKIS